MFHPNEKKTELLRLLVSFKVMLDELVDSFVYTLMNFDSLCARVCLSVVPKEFG